MKISDADKSSLLFKLFNRWKKNRNDKLAKKLLKKNPELGKALKDLDNSWSKTMKDLEDEDRLKPRDLKFNK